MTAVNKAATKAAVTPKPFHHGLPLFLLIVALGAMPLFSVRLGQIAVGVLFALWLLTLVSVKQAAADRSSDAAQATSETGS